MNQRSREIRRLRLSVQGTVQGVGFRPAVYRLAVEMGLEGWVSNTSQGVIIEVEGPIEDLGGFRERLPRTLPPLAKIYSLEASELDPSGYSGFEIRESRQGEKTALILPDISTCAECLREVFDPDDRRYRYPFTNCTNCGPRFSIIESIPYDRPNTTMRNFRMCDQCLEEYRDPGNRRFHAQPNACPVCGPALSLVDGKGEELAGREAALGQALQQLREGRILAVKGLGGFHLICLARREESVAALRSRKGREAKPLALMVPDEATAEELVILDDAERRVLLSPERPILLARRQTDRNVELSSSIAPGNPYLGIMLPYTPLHHLLLRELGQPVVATSGNLSDEPICIDNLEALNRLGGVADLFLMHDRPIARHVDDSVVSMAGRREMVLRRARGFAPLPVPVGRPLEAVLGLGAHLKNSVALGRGRFVFLSQHIGDLETGEAYSAFRRAVEDLPRLYDTTPTAVACDLHPEYLSTDYARGRKEPRIEVQHHYAHVLSCMAENSVSPPVLGVAWDGTGYGIDGTIWGGEFLEVFQSGFRRAAHLRTFSLPGSEQAVREPRRSALGLLYEIFGPALFDMELAPLTAFSSAEKRVLGRMLDKGWNAPRTSSAGRLFDAIAALLDIRQTNRFEGEAAMELEFRIDWSVSTSYAFSLEAEPVEGVNGAEGEGSLIVDWEPMIRELLDDLSRQCSSSLIVSKFHNSLVEMILAVAEAQDIERVMLTGGCFQNRYLVQRSIERLRSVGLSPYWHQRVPPNDGGIALGQVMAAGSLER